MHRDLKLENFLFEDHNSNSPLILIDFGLSKHFSPNERLTQKVGSCYYTAPEVLNGNYDHRCDVWSLGVLCYMLLSGYLHLHSSHIKKRYLNIENQKTGSPPFFGKSVEDVYHSILNKEANFNDKKFKHISNSCMDFMKVRTQAVLRSALLLCDLLMIAPILPLSSSSALACSRSALPPHLRRGVEAPIHIWCVLLPEVRQHSSRRDRGRRTPYPFHQQSQPDHGQVLYPNRLYRRNCLVAINNLSLYYRSFMIYVKADNLTRVLMKMVAHSFGSTEVLSSLY